MPKQYLGDSVYVELENGMLKLTTENGAGANNTIFMEPQVYEALELFVSDLREQGSTEEVNPDG